MSTLEEIYDATFEEISGACLVAQVVKQLAAMQETWVQSQGQEDPLEKEMSTHSSTFAWKIPHGQRSRVGHSPRGFRVRHD